MEEMLRLWSPVNLADMGNVKKILCRSSIVKGCMILLCMTILSLCADYYGECYYREIVKDRKCVSGVDEKTPGIVVSDIPLKKEDAGFPLASVKMPVEKYIPVKDVEPARDVSENTTVMEICVADEAGVPAAEASKDMETAGASDRTGKTMTSAAEAVNVAPDETKIVAEIPVIKISVYGNGGAPALTEMTCKAGEFTADNLRIPVRLGKLFDGWYRDADCTTPFTGADEGEETLALYAGWKEFPGFLSNDDGYITGCTGLDGVTTDGLLRLPGYAECTGIEAGALGSVSGSITEIFIPVNITYIAPGAFDDLPNLMYIEVMEGNPAYYSENGVLYTADGSLLCFPQGR